MNDMGPANPASPLSPINPLNPTSPYRHGLIINSGKENVGMTLPLKIMMFAFVIVFIILIIMWIKWLWNN